MQVPCSMTVGMSGLQGFPVSLGVGLSTHASDTWTCALCCVLGFAFQRAGWHVFSWREGYVSGETWGGCCPLKCSDLWFSTFPCSRAFPCITSSKEDKCPQKEAIRKDLLFRKVLAGPPPSSPSSVYVGFLFLSGVWAWVDINIPLWRWGRLEEVGGGDAGF